MLVSFRPIQTNIIVKFYDGLGNHFFVLKTSRNAMKHKILTFKMKGDVISLLLGHWYEIMALYYIKSILTEISASRQDRRVLQKSKIIKIEFLSKWGMLKTSRYV